MKVISFSADYHKMFRGTSSDGPGISPGSVNKNGGGYISVSVALGPTETQDDFKALVDRVEVAITGK